MKVTFHEGGPGRKATFAIEAPLEACNPSTLRPFDSLRSLRVESEVYRWYSTRYARSGPSASFLPFGKLRVGGFRLARLYLKTGSGCPKDPFGEPLVRLPASSCRR